MDSSETDDGTKLIAQVAIQLQEIVDGQSIIIGQLESRLCEEQRKREDFENEQNIRIASLESQLTEERKKREECESELEDQVDLQKEIIKLKAERDRAQEALKKKNEEMSTVRRSMRQSQEDNWSLQNKIDRLTAEIKFDQVPEAPEIKQCNECDEKKALCEQLQLEKTKLQQRLTKSNHEILSREASISEKNELIAELKKEVSEITSKYMSLFEKERTRGKLEDEFKEKIAQLEEENESLRSEMRMFCTSYEALCENEAAVRASNEELINGKVALEQEIAKLTAELEQARTEIESYNMNCADSYTDGVPSESEDERYSSVEGAKSELVENTEAVQVSFLQPEESEEVEESSTRVEELEQEVTMLKQKLEEMNISAPSYLSEEVEHEIEEMECAISEEREETDACSKCLKLCRLYEMIVNTSAFGFDENDEKIYTNSLFCSKCIETISSFDGKGYIELLNERGLRKIRRQYSFLLVDENHKMIEESLSSYSRLLLEIYKVFQSRYDATCKREASSLSREEVEHLRITAKAISKACDVDKLQDRNTYLADLLDILNDSQAIHL